MTTIISEEGSRSRINSLCSPLRKDAGAAAPAAVEPLLCTGGSPDSDCIQHHQELQNNTETTASAQINGAANFQLY